VPPLGGAFTKEAIVAVAMDYSPWVGAGVLLAGFMSAFYGARLYVLAYGRSLDDSVGSAAAVGAATSAPADSRSLPRRLLSTEVWTMGLLAGASVLLGLLRVPPIWRALERATATRESVEPLWQLAVSLLAISAAFTAVRALHRRGLLLSLGLPPAAQARVGDWLGLPTLVRRGVAEPTFAVALLLRRLDDRVIDAGVWGVARSAIRSAARFRSIDERVVDGVVRGVASAALLGAAVSRAADDLGIDGAVEWIVRASWWSGKQVRRLQTGLSHQYYVIVLVGLVVALAFTAMTN
jgi:NADH-quinone oxidoreductase subunit L